MNRQEAKKPRKLVVAAPAAKFLCRRENIAAGALNRTTSWLLGILAVKQPFAPDSCA